ncbi:hypothetical protein [Vibrio nereis]|uniref:hypothetical protein n=1 Tax=Vibrio nereis TaxID=693 RepID=UPI002494E399|nr:hypothetical protein [Vibrio nereis]
MYKIYLFIFLLFAIGCQQLNSVTVESELKERLIPLDFTIIESVIGDYDGDGVEDVAAIIKCNTCLVTSTNIQSESIWLNDNLSVEGEQALAIALDIGSSKGSSYILLSEYDRFTSPSFKLLKAVQTEMNSFLEGIQPDGEVLIIPSEAGIDEFIFFLNGQVMLIFPEDIP